MAKLKLVIVAILTFLFIILLLQNTEVVSLKLFFWEISMSRILFFPVLLLTGFIIGFVVAKLAGPEARDKESL
jgi:uncharacterized integral membrane protein